RILALALTLLVLSQGWGLYLIILAYVAGNALTLGVNLAGVRRSVRLRPVLDIPYCWGLARRSLLLATAVIAGSLYFRIDMVLLAGSSTTLQYPSFGCWNLAFSFSFSPRCSSACCWPVIARVDYSS